MESAFYALTDGCCAAWRIAKGINLHGRAVGFGAANNYFTHRKWEFFAEHLLGDRQKSADIMVKH